MSSRYIAYTYIWMNTPSGSVHCIGPDVTLFTYIYFYIWRIWWNRCDIFTHKISHVSHHFCEWSYLYKKCYVWSIVVYLFALCQNFTYQFKNSDLVVPTENEQHIGLQNENDKMYRFYLTSSIKPSQSSLHCFQLCFKFRHPNRSKPNTESSCLCRQKYPKNILLQELTVTINC